MQFGIRKQIEAKKKKKRIGIQFWNSNSKLVRSRIFVLHKIRLKLPHTEKEEEILTESSMKSKSAQKRRKKKKKIKNM